MEELKSSEAKEIFKSLKIAIKNYEYRDIAFYSKMDARPCDC
jgi:hypothetical protein